MTDTTEAYNVTAEELTQFLERYEQLDAEESGIKDQKKDLKAEIKGRGYDTAVFMALVAIRKKNPDDVAEFDAVLEMYKNAIGMD